MFVRMDKYVLSFKMKSIDSWLNIHLTTLWLNSTEAAALWSHRLRPMLDPTTPHCPTVAENHHHTHPSSSRRLKEDNKRLLRCTLSVTDWKKAESNPFIKLKGSRPLS